MAALAGALVSLLLYGIISRFRSLRWAAAVGLPLAAALLCGSWLCLLLIPLLLAPSLCDLPRRVLQAIPSMGLAQTALIPESALTQGAPQVVSLCLPFQTKTTPLRRKGGHVLFNTAVALCADQCADAEGLTAYARLQGFDPARLISRMPRCDQSLQAGCIKLCHQDAASLRWFVCADPEALLPACSQVLDGAARTFVPHESAQLLELCRQYRADGQTLYAFACGDSANGPFTYLGLAGLRPLIRESLPAQLKRLHALGARPILWASSPIATAWSLACQCHLVQPGDCLATHEDLTALSDAALTQQAPSIRVLHGLDRSDRRRFAHALQASGHTLLTLDDRGLAVWEKALIAQRKLTALSRRLHKLSPAFTYLPCAGVALGAAVQLWPLSVLATLLGLGAWVGLALLVKQNIQTLAPKELENK